MLANILILLIYFISLVGIITATIWYKNKREELTEEQYEILEELIKAEEEKRKYL